MWKARETELAAGSSANMRKHSPLVRYVVYTLHITLLLYIHYKYIHDLKTLNI